MRSTFLWSQTYRLYQTIFCEIQFFKWQILGSSKFCQLSVSWIGVSLIKEQRFSTFYSLWFKCFTAFFRWSSLFILLTIQFHSTHTLFQAAYKKDRVTYSLGICNLYHNKALVLVHNLHNITVVELYSMNVIKGQTRS